MTERFHTRLHVYTLRDNHYHLVLGTLEATLPWLTCGEILRGMGVGRKAQQKASREYVESAAREGLQHSPWELLQAQVVLGEEAFVRWVEESSQGTSGNSPASGVCASEWNFRK